MGRRRGTDRRGQAFTQERIDQVWDRAAGVRGKPRNSYRRDVAGNVIYKPMYGKDTPMGWEIDHKMPVSKGGSDNLRNLQALQTATNQAKGNTYPWKP